MKRLNFKKLFGIFVFYSGYYYLISILKKIIRKQEFVILMYHRISKDIKIDDSYYSSLINANIKNLKNFEAQIKYLSKSYNVVTFDELLRYYKDKKLPRNTAVITFDDGYKYNYLLAYPILRKYNLPATILVTTGHIANDKLFWWDKIDYIIKKTKIKKIMLDGVGTFSTNNKEKIISRIQEKLKNVEEKKKNVFQKD